MDRHLPVLRGIASRIEDAAAAPRLGPARRR
jgi:hypothetical protein